MKGYEAVTRSAAGRRSDYACEKTPFEGGQADVFKAVHKPSGITVALKRLRAARNTSVARMAREIEVGRLLDGHPHAMPILDADPGNTWFVMPWAEQSAENLNSESRTDEALHVLIRSLCSVLALVHAAGWVHRDIKPSNILLLDGRWVVADWGIARGPRGHTPNHCLTRAGVSMGSQGFAAPELSDDAHSAGPQADIYSIGQLIGWWLTGRQPRANRAHIPDSGPWRTVVRAATREDPGKRPANVGELLTLIARDVELSAKPPIALAAALQGELIHGSQTAAEALIALADAHIDDAGLFCDVLVGVDEEKLLPALAADLARATGVVQAMAGLLGTTRVPEGSEVDATILWLFNIARHAAQTGQFQLVEECLDGVFRLDAKWNQPSPQEKIRSWLSLISGDAASSAADMLQNHPDSAIHFIGLATDDLVDRRIRSTLGNA
ncbi:serine/threonine-protein kinase [Streptomyces sp. NBC_00986]|uniref:serine/threonine-protein kinase n=1 Tax=Streptomyces sp. NBC_00986 TaxID=2903702 RepID=UPI00386AB06D|nr:serine/threonine protein kinase [Streptomyces sp. NBC_00986]